MGGNTGDFKGKMLAESVEDSLPAFRYVLFAEEKAEPMPPAVVHGLRGVKPQHVRAKIEPGGGVGEAGKPLVHQWLYCFLKKPFAELKTEKEGKGRSHNLYMYSK